ncbi:MAG: endonuclease MutS2 [Planctomycetota bacterium]
MSSRERPAHAPSVPTDARSAGARALEHFTARALQFAEVRGLLERYALTSLGLRALRELAPRAYDDAKHALSRAREMAERSARGDVPNLSGVSDPMPALEHARTAGRPLDDEALVALLNLFEALARLTDWAGAHAGALPHCAALFQGLPDVQPMRERIDTTVDERGRVRDHASPLLFRLRKETAELAQSIDKTLRGLLARAEIKAVLSDPTPHRRGGRTVLAVRAKSSGRVPGIVHDRSQSGESVFVEPREVVALANRHAECEADERHEVERILLELTREILAQEPALRTLSGALAELELALIAARLTRESGESGWNARIPAIQGEPGAAAGLLLRGARHPLLVEQVRLGRLERVVPIDIRLGGDFDLLILTGPNTGGKTLALKTAGLAALLMRCGMPFPCAEGSTVPLYEGIVADIGDEQEISQNLSTFSSHLVRIQDGLVRATPKTLVLLDELGGGTDPDEGAALSEAILEQFLARKSPTLVSTHIGKLKEFAFRHPRAENACVEFDVKTLAPLYKILVGTPGESGALVIARRLGLPAAVVDRAGERLERRDAEVIELMADVRQARTQAEHVRTRAEEHLAGATRTTQELAAQKDDLERQRGLLAEEAQKGIEERVRTARKILERATPLLAQLPTPGRKALEEILGELERELSGTALSDRRQAFLASLRKGSFVYLPRYRQRLAVHKVDAANREIVVQLGKMRLTVSFDEVTSYESL